MMAVIVTAGRLADVAEKTRVRPQIRADLAREIISGATHAHRTLPAERLSEMSWRLPVDRDMFSLRGSWVNQDRRENGQ
jgi:hypothetical protein